MIKGSLQSIPVDQRSELLNFIAENGIIDMRRACEEMRMRELERIKKEHLRDHGKFTQREDRGKTYYYTTFDRKAVRANSEEELWDKLLTKYKEKKSCPTIDKIYQEKLGDKYLSGASLRKYKRNYKTYIEGTGLSRVKISVVTSEWLEKFVKKVIKEKQLNIVQYSDFVWILKDILKRARKKKLIDFSPEYFFKDIEIEKNELQLVPKRPLCKKIFTDEESAKVLKYIEENPTIHNWAIEMIFRTGARCGEVAALVKDDFDRESMTVNISKTEITKDKEDASPEELLKNTGKKESKSICIIQDYPKTSDSYRSIVLEDKAIELLDKILGENMSDEYLFSVDGHRIRSNALRKSLYRICDAVGIPRRGLHCIRRYYATTLLDADIEDEFVQLQLGHADIKTTRDHYLYCKTEIFKKRQQIKKAINF